MNSKPIYNILKASSTDDFFLNLLIKKNINKHELQLALFNSQDGQIKNQFLYMVE